MGSRFLIGLGFGLATGMYGISEMYRKRLVESNRKLIEASKLVHYLAHLLEEHNVPISEFESIAVQALVQNVKESS